MTLSRRSYTWQLVAFTGAIIGTGQAETKAGVGDQLREAVAHAPFGSTVGTGHYTLVLLEGDS